MKLHLGKSKKKKTKQFSGQNALKLGSKKDQPLSSKNLTKYMNF